VPYGVVHEIGHDATQFVPISHRPHRTVHVGHNDLDPVGPAADVAGERAELDRLEAGRQW
jgi:hypothetical protein